MGALTGQNLIDELKFLLQGRDETDDTISDTRILRWVNWGYGHITFPNIHRHRETRAVHDVTLVTNDGDYAIDSTTVGFDINAILSVVHYETTGTPGLTDTKERLKPVSVNYFENRIITAGKPNRYSIDGTNLLIDSPPDSSYNGQKVRIRCYRTPADLTTSTNTVIKNVFDEVLLQAAKWRAERDLGYRERAELTKQDFTAILNEYGESDMLDAVEEIEHMSGVIGQPY